MDNLWPNIKFILAHEVAEYKEVEITGCFFFGFFVLRIEEDG